MRPPEALVRLNDRVRDHGHVQACREQFPVGRHVRRKPDAGYDWPGEVCGYGVSRAGRLTINVENRLSPGTIHVFPPSMLLPEDRDMQEILAEVERRALRTEDM